MAINLLLPSTAIITPFDSDPAASLINTIFDRWCGSVTSTEYTLHQLSPFIGKMKSSMARTLLDAFTNEGDNIYDPFSGSGTVALEAWASGRNIIANDLSPYAFTLTHAKLFPYYNVEEALQTLQICSVDVSATKTAIMLNDIPEWVQAFFHPETLQEIVSWMQILMAKQLYFFLACLLGILHHQRPGFLSYPSSHTVPYLRVQKFPRDQYPEMYIYRSVYDRLQRKVIRALKRLPVIASSVDKECCLLDASKFVPSRKVDAIVTSPPYMRQLDYARDNRLRLWFLGMHDWQSMETDVSPSEGQFLRVMTTCLSMWQDVLRRGGLCVMVLGDTESKAHKMRLPDLVAHIATEQIGGYSVIWKHTEAIPSARRVRRGCRGSQNETILVLRNDKGI